MTSAGTVTGPLELSVDCPAGTVVVGGGAAVTTVAVFGENVFLQRSEPTATGWIARSARSDGASTNWSMSVKALCMDAE
ncbi:MAG: hypothetical protein MJE66_24885 [Proteobacteria bacterium]|nr:hypothetical protein [Pseudomonadota bacterium]